MVAPATIVARTPMRTATLVTRSKPRSRSCSCGTCSSSGLTAETSLARVLDAAEASLWLKLGRAHLRFAQIQAPQRLCNSRIVSNHQRRQLRWIEISRRGVHNVPARHGVDLRNELFEVGVRQPVEPEHRHRPRNLLCGLKSARIPTRQ